MIIDMNSNQNEDEKLNSEKKIWILQRPTIIQTIWICDLSFMCDYNAGIEDIFALMLLESYTIFNPRGEGCWLNHKFTIPSCANFMMIVCNSSNNFTGQDCSWKFIQITEFFWLWQISRKITWNSYASQIFAPKKPMKCYRCTFAQIEWIPRIG